MKNYKKTIAELGIGHRYLFMKRGLFSKEYFDGEVIDLAMPQIPPRKGYIISFKLIKIKLIDKSVKWFEVNDISALAEFISEDFSECWETPWMKEYKELSRNDKEGK
jgi:hypothetical protein